MLELLRDLFAHKAWADAAVLSAIRADDGAASDPELRKLLEHIQLANRFWLANVTGTAFSFETARQPAETLDELIGRYQHTSNRELAWIADASEGDLTRVLQVDLIPGGSCTVVQGLMQVCLHSHGHRAQCAKMLRRHGSTPPVTDFIWWLARRPPAEWPTIVPAGESARD